MGCGGIKSDPSKDKDSSTSQNPCGWLHLGQGVFEDVVKLKLSWVAGEFSFLGKVSGTWEERREAQVRCRDHTGDHSYAIPGQISRANRDWER